MLVVVDIGNSNLTLALAREGTIVATRRAAVDRHATPDDLEALLASVIDFEHAAQGGRDARAIVVSSTVPALGEAIEEVAARRGIPCLSAGASTVPIEIRLDNPAAVGPDRLINAFAAVRLHRAPAVVIDCGTATTFDAVSHDGAFVGGAIAPGIEIGMEALAARTARLPRVALHPPARVIGRDTEEAIQAGTVLGHRAMIEGMLRFMRADLARAGRMHPSAVRAILTGGFSNLPWALTIEGIDHVDPLLTIKGLVAFHAAVAGSPRVVPVS